ncbi:hypothetical protein LCGC14_1100590 [marine sediment metagenome]|uniref:histidine kinase n=1 Tax=marine sediment metagenome TaxID=412755 RepID=A0A0F9M9J3_9ZZZZ
MNAKAKIISFIKNNFFFNPSDSLYIRKSKFLNILLFICGIVSCIVLLIPPIFNVFGIPSGFEERINTILSGSLILLGSIIIILLVKKLVSKLFANLLFILLITLLIFISGDLELLSSGMIIFWYFLPILLSSLLFRSIWSIVITIGIFITIFINYLTYSLFPSSIDLVGLLIFSSIILFSSQILEKSLIYSQNTEKDTREAYNRVEFYKDLFSHDVSNILQNLQVFIDLTSFNVREHGKVEDFNKLINIANQQIYRGANLVLNVRKLTELEKMNPIVANEDLMIELDQAIKNIKNSFQDKNVNISTITGKQKIYTKSNNMLIYLFENLFRNSIVYNNNQSVEISIEISKRKINDIGFVELKFTDNGVGIHDSRKDKIFFRGPIKKSDLGRIGLGLTLVNKILENLNGQIKVEDKIKGDYKQGSIFTLLIPESE